MKTCCDYECAEANNCQVGGVECESCGGHFCSSDLCDYNGQYVCDDCIAEIENEEGDEDENDR